jgi:acylphosphatase
VWFREGCRREALARGVDGWVRNLDDGRVEVVLEGPGAAVEAMVAWCGVGPPPAQVTTVEVRVELLGVEQGFAVR